MKLNKEETLENLNIYYNFMSSFNDNVDLSLTNNSDLEMYISDDTDCPKFLYLNKEKQEELYQILGFILNKEDNEILLEKVDQYKRWFKEECKQFCLHYNYDCINDER